MCNTWIRGAGRISLWSRRRGSFLFPGISLAAGAYRIGIEKEPALPSKFYQSRLPVYIG